jgi:pimeloyl-ACP methyl ester carboxylesterase/class 3 adenylate cyclase
MMAGTVRVGGTFEGLPMADTAEIRYVAVGDADVAYQVVGDGPHDVLYFQGLGRHLELFHETPGFEEFLDRLSSIARVIVFDRRGSGASDGVPLSAIPTIEQWTDDVLAVLDAVRSERAAIIAAVDATPVALLFAAMHPERVSGLVLVNAAARFLRDIDYPVGASVEEVDALIEWLRATWGTVEFVRATNPGREDPFFLENTARLLRIAATPRSAAAQFDYILKNLDVREALPLVQAPTRVLHGEDSTMVPIEHGRYLADHIEGATFTALPGGSMSMSPLLGAIADETMELLTGERPIYEIDRVLATVVHTDMVVPAQRAASVGEQLWRALLDAHEKIVRDQLERHQGREIDRSGDSFFASFDGPARAIRCAQEIVSATRALGIELRVGLHTGECEVRGDRLGGLAVHIAARVGALAEPGQILVSRTVKDLVVGGGIAFRNCGSHVLEGVAGPWKLYSVKD